MTRHLNYLSSEELNRKYAEVELLLQKCDLSKEDRTNALYLSMMIRDEKKRRLNARSAPYYCGRCLTPHNEPRECPMRDT